MRAARPSGNRRARVEGSAGVEPRLRGLVRMIWPVPLAAALAGYLVRAAWPSPALSAPVAGLGLIALVAVLFGYLYPSRKRMARFVKGARGEENVARELALLPSDHLVFHGVRIPSAHPGGARADCDHIVLNPRGVVVVETKNWTGPIEIRNGRLQVEGAEPDRPPLVQVKRAAAALRAAFSNAGLQSVPVRPVLVFASNALPVDAQGLEGVRLCRLNALRRVIGESDDPPLPDDVLPRAVACIRPWVNTA